MSKSDYKMDLSMYERFEKEMERICKYEPVFMLATRNSTPRMVECRKDAEPYCWRIVGNLFDVTFLSYRDLENYIKSHELHEWSEADDKVYGKRISNMVSGRIRYEL